MLEPVYLADIGPVVEFPPDQGSVKRVWEEVERVFDEHNVGPELREVSSHRSKAP